MRAFTASLLLLTLSLTAGGCGTDSPLETLSADAHGAVLFGHAATNQHAVRGSCEATGSELLGFNPPILHQVGTAVCEISHMGRVSIRTVQQINIATGAQTAEGTWTTANGDLVYVTALGTGITNGTSIHFTGVATIAGGTGRFAGAGGTLSVEGTVDSVTGHGSFRYDGWIVYRAAGRADG